EDDHLRRDRSVVVEGVEVGDLPGKAAMEHLEELPFAIEARAGPVALHRLPVETEEIVETQTGVVDDDLESRRFGTADVAAEALRRIGEQFRVAAPVEVLDDVWGLF